VLSAPLRAILSLAPAAACVALLAAAPAASARQPLVTLALPSHAAVGKVVTAKGRVRGTHRSGRRVALQRRSGKRFTTFKRAKVTRGGRFAIRFRVPVHAAGARAARAHAAASSRGLAYRAVVTSHGHVIGESGVDVLAVDTRTPTPSLDDPAPVVKTPTPSLQAPTPSLTPYQVRFTGSSTYAFDDHHVLSGGLDHKQTQNSTLDWATTYKNLNIPTPVTATQSATGLDELTGSTERHVLDTINGQTNTDQTCSGSDPAEVSLENNPPEVDVSRGLDAEHFTVTVEAFTNVEMNEECDDGTYGHMEPFNNDDSNDPELAYGASAQVAYADLQSAGSHSSVVVPVQVSPLFQNQDCAGGASGRTCSSNVDWRGDVVIRRTDGAGG
jgi:hypothetical protein